MFKRFANQLGMIIERLFEAALGAIAPALQHKTKQRRSTLIGMRS
ncbi:hypothetical protein ACW73L_19435 [Methylolobus aquaticus]